VRYVLMGLVLVSGMLIPVQIASNKKLYEVVRSPVLAIALAMAVGAAVLAMLELARVGDGTLSAVPKAPWWVWLGGLCIAFAVTIQVINARQEGMGPIMALIVAGELAAAMVVDHFGWLDIKQDPIRWWKIAGVILMAGGAALLQIKGK
jgi:transporter family-2 protein